MLDENKIKKLSEVFGRPKVEIRQLFSNNPQEIVLTFDDALDYLKHGGSYYSSTYDRVIIGVIKTSEQWSKIFDLLADDAIKNDKDDPHISNVFMSKWVIAARKEMDNTDSLGDKITIFDRFPWAVQQRLEHEINKLQKEIDQMLSDADEIIHISLDYEELASLIKVLSKTEATNDLITRAHERFLLVVSKAIPKIKDTNKLLRIGKQFQLPPDIQKVLLRRLYEIME